MTDTTTSAAADVEITPEKVERLRRRIGIPQTVRGQPWWTVASEDAFRHFAHAYGEDNPLFIDPEYGRQSMWGSIIAPPGFVQQASTKYPIELSEEQQAAFKGGDPLRGINAYFSGVELEWWEPIRPGDRTQAINTLTAVEDKRSEYAGTTVLTWNGTLWVKSDGTPMGSRNFIFVHAPRKAAKDKGKYKDVERASYDDELLERIDHIMAAENRRGAEPRWWESVAEGDELPEMVRGPLLVVDIIAWHMGTGVGQTNAIVGNRQAWKNRQRVPKFYTRNALGAWDSVQRCHWDDEWANEVGQPFAYDYGPLRDCWAQSFLGNWMGDDAWLWKYRSSIRKFNYIGDTTFFTGKVVNRYQEGDLPVVQVAFTGMSQRGVETMTGEADIILPREGQALQMPAAPGGSSGDPMQVLEGFIRR